MVSELRELENQAIVKIVEKQKELDFKAVTDGELRRAWWHYNFLEQLNEVEGYVTQQLLHFKGADTKTYGIRITDDISFPDEHPFVEDLIFLQRVANKPL